MWVCDCLVSGPRDAAVDHPGDSDSAFFYLLCADSYNSDPGTVAAMLF